jgi:hypothetical protein
MTPPTWGSSKRWSLILVLPGRAGPRTPPPYVGVSPQTHGDRRLGAMLRRIPLPLAALILLVLLAACQPSDDPALEGDPAEDEPTSQAPAGQPDQVLPETFDELLAGFESTARQWQDDPVVAEIFVELEGRAWTAASVLYLAPDADRYLRVRTDRHGTTQDRLTLEGLELSPVSGEGLASLPEPDPLLDPGPLVDAAAVAIDTCGVGAVASVLYATGAPAAWDGQRWTEEPTWTATLSGAADAVVDPVTGEPAGTDPCPTG